MGAPDTCPHCGTPLPRPSPSGGRPRLYCNDQCRWNFHRSRTQRWCPLDQRHQRQTDTRRQRRHLRQQAETLASTAQRLAHDLRAEDLAQPTHQTGWTQGPIAGYTAAALPLLSQARATLAAAVTTDRAAGATWHEIVAVLGTSADTAARHYRT
ncbi:hypothetical protein [Actinoallomurus sp. NPDC050550]|uniref:hypothetical protein n=1 Tax=Actinoallomurus sp. NPDC050550 TaxID=3154937 RepID=UPI0033D53439